MIGYSASGSSSLWANTVVERGENSSMFSPLISSRVVFAVIV